MQPLTIQHLLTKQDIPENAITVSPSQLATWQTCRYKWKLAKIDLRTPLEFSTEALNRGTMFHKMAEKWYGMFIGQPVEQLDSGQLIQLLQEVEEENKWTSYEAQMMIYPVFTVFCSYMRYMTRNENVIPLATEVETYAPTGLISRDGRPIYIHGIIDLLVDRNGDFGVLDHKSHTNRPWSQSQLTFDLQLFFYSLLLVLQGVNVDFACINTVNLFIPKGKNEAKNQENLNNDDRFDRLTVEHSEAKLMIFQEEIFDHIREMWCDEDPRYPMSINRNCAKCGFSEVCDMKLSGGDIQALLRNKYTATKLSIVGDLDFENEIT